jgi:hypothetical protein
MFISVSLLGNCSVETLLRHQIEMSGQLYAPTSLPPGNYPAVPIVQQIAGAPEAVMDAVK